MKIVNRTTFLTMPEGTVYAKYRPCIFEDLCIKGKSIFFTSGDDFFYQQIVDSIDATGSADMWDQLDNAETNGSSMSMDFETQTRDGLFNADQLFAVWEPEDIHGLIVRLQRALKDADE